MEIVHRLKDNRDYSILMLKIALITLITLLALVWLTILTVSRYHYQNGINALSLQNYDIAFKSLSSAEKVLPNKFNIRLVSRDIFRIHLALGETLYQRASADSDVKQRFELLKDAHEYINSAAKLSPLSYMAQYWLAKITGSLEPISSVVDKDAANPYNNVLELYQTAADLRPSGITVRYEMLRYMASKGVTEGFDELTGYLAQIFPTSYYYLKKEPFYSDELRETIKEGVIRAAEQNITPRTTYQVLSSIYNDEKDFEKAAFYYQESLRFMPYQNQSGNFLHLGRLLMQSGDNEQAQAMFITALKQGTDLKRTLSNIYHYYKVDNKHEDFITFSQIIEEQFGVSEELDIIMARCRMDMELYGLARAILIRREAAAPSAPVYSMLAELAAKEKDWSEMERTSQRATVLEPENISHWLVFSSALRNNKKFDRAEEAASTALNLAQNDSHKLNAYNHRAWSRWGAAKWQETAEDWQEALKIKPDNPSYIYYLSLAYNRLGQYDKSLEYARKAAQLQPDNETFTKWYRDIEEKFKQTRAKF